MKKTVMLNLALLLSGVIFINHVNADEIYYYTNSNGVSMTESQYNYLQEMFFEDFPTYITQSEYNDLLTRNMFAKSVQKVSSTDENTSAIARGSYHETGAKKLSISKSCGATDCLIVLTNAWKGDPAVKSYDLIGSLLFSDLTLDSDVVSKLYYSGGTLYGDGFKSSNNGFAESFKLPESDSTITVTQHYYVYGDGTVFGSYQHATSKISLATSQKFTCEYGGYGGVFEFYGSAVGKYDRTAGVDMGITI